MNQHAVVSKFSHVKPGDTEFKGGGLRDFFLYRDLGIADATGGQVICHLVKANPDLPPEDGTGWHQHECEFQIVIMTKGWARSCTRTSRRWCRPATSCTSGPASRTTCSITRRTWSTSKSSARPISGLSTSAGRRQGAAADPLEVTAMSSPEELTLVVGRWLRPIVVMLHVVRRLGFRPISSREQGSTALNQ